MSMLCAAYNNQEIKDYKKLSQPSKTSILIIGQVYQKQYLKSGFKSNDVFMKEVIPEETDERMKELGRAENGHVRRRFQATPCSKGLQPDP